MSVFLESVSINFLRHAPWYLDRIKALESENPYLYEKFMKGHLTVKNK